MFKATDSQWGLFGAASQLSDSARRRLDKSWAEGFRAEVLPLLMGCESEFAFIYSEIGRPNYSVGRILGVILLQEMHNQSDQEALDALSFDVRWQHALDVVGDEAYLSRRSLVEFRRRLVEHDSEMTLIRKVFERISSQALQKLGLKMTEQRLDSTLVMSNIRVGGLLELFRSTTKHFLKGLDEKRLRRVPKEIRDWYERKSDGWFGLGPSERRDKLDELVVWVKTLIDLFAKDKEVVASERYQLVVRVFDEHCEVVTHKTRNSSRRSTKGKQRGKGKERKGKKSKGGGRTRSVWTTTEEIILRNKKGATVQSPHDPDAEWGHKGTGYSTHITETCNNEDKTEIITDYEVHGNARSDVGKATDVVERLEEADLKPDALFSDAGYPTPESQLELEENGTNLFAPVNRGKLGDEVMGRDRFVFDESGRVTQCPRGHKPIDHRVQNPNGEGRHLHAFFDGDTCRRCPDLERCPVRAPNQRAKGCSPRESRGNFRLDICPALRRRDERFAEQKSKEWKDRYRIRSGVEATMSELKRGHGMAKLRVRRLPRVTFAVACKVTACNIKRWIRALPAPRGGRAGPLRAIWTFILTYLLLWRLGRADTSTTLIVGDGCGGCAVADSESQGLAIFPVALASAV